MLSDKTPSSSPATPKRKASSTTFALDTKMKRGGGGGALDLGSGVVQVVDDDLDDLDDVAPRRKEQSRSKEDVLLERKATLDPAFMQMLTVPDDVDESENDEKLFKTNETLYAAQDENGGDPTVPYSQMSRTTGFESWLRSKTSVRKLYTKDEDVAKKTLLVFKNLNVSVLPVKPMVPMRVQLGCENFARECLNMGVENATEGFPVLKNVSGMMVAGQTTLLIGPPGAGATTLLRALSGRLQHGENVTWDYARQEGVGDLNLTDTMQRRRSAFVAADDKSHLPLLTVRETMDFAARLSYSGPADQTTQEREVMIDELVSRVVESLGLSDQSNTIVGGNEIRGVSGGQKRRCTLGEMLFSREAKLLLLDDISNGLDSAKALQIMRIIRSACRVLGFSAMVSLLQPNDMLFDMFDNVLILTSSGEIAFAGPVKEAVPFFENFLERHLDETKDWTRPPGMSSAEYVLVSVLRCEEKIGAVELAKRFAASADGVKYVEQVEANGKKTETAELDPVLTNLQPYAVSYWMQFRFLVKRRALLISRNPVTIARILVAIAFGLIVGTLFSALGQDLVSGLARSGYMFLSIFLIFMLATAITVPDNFAMRQTFYKQHDAHFYAGWVYYAAQIVCDIPIAFAESFILSIVSYFWAGMRSNDASGFFYFFAILLAMEFVGQATSRAISSLCPSEALAQMIASGFILFCGLIAGYMPHYDGINWGWRWVNWITPVSYALEGLVVNNYVAMGVSDAKFPILDISANLSIGSITGVEMAAALGQPRIPFSKSSPGLNDAGKVMGFDLGMLFVFALVFDLCGLAILYWSHSKYAPSTRKTVKYVGTGDAASFLKDLFSHFDMLKQEEIKAKESAAGIPSSASVVKPSPMESSKSVNYVETICLTVADLSYFVSKPMGSAAEAGVDKDRAATSAKPIPIPDLPKNYLKNSNSAALSSGMQGKTTTFWQEYVNSAKNHPGEDKICFSFTNFYTTLLLKLNLMGKRGQPRPHVGRPDQDDQDALPVEEQIHLSVHRPRTGSKRGRAWSNKLPLGEEEDLALDTKEGELQLLTNVTAVFKSGEMTALMGESGSGKSTFMDVVAGYKTEGRIKGNVFVNGKKPTKEAFKMLVGYAEQHDLHISTLSVFESLMFSAKCRAPRNHTHARMTNDVEDIMRVLEITKYRNVVMGREEVGEGVAKHVRKRVTIGVELAACPKILFADEPTSDLDSLGAEIVANALRRAADDLNVCVVATIHQPSRSIFGRFDRLLFFQRGGAVVYHGAISSFRPFGDSPNKQSVDIVKSGAVVGGPATVMVPPKEPDWKSVRVIQRQLSDFSRQTSAIMIPNEEVPAPTIGDSVLAYFSKLGAPPLKQGFNPADHLLIAVETLSEQGIDVAEMFEDSEEHQTLWKEVAVQTGKDAPPLPSVHQGAQIHTQIWLLIWRGIMTQWRDPVFFFARFAWYLLAAFGIGTVFIQLGCGLQDAVYRIAALFFCVYVAIIPMQVAVVPLVRDRAVVYRETAAGTYSKWSLGVARFIADIPFHILFALCFYAIVYYAVGFSKNAEKTGYFILMIFFAFWMLTSFGQAMATVSPNVEFANGVSGVIVLASTLVMGFLVPVRLMPRGFQNIIWINFLYYILQGLCVNEMAGSFLVLRLPSNQTLQGCPTSLNPSGLQSSGGGFQIPRSLAPNKLQSFDSYDQGLSPAALSSLSSVSYANDFALRGSGLGVVAQNITCPPGAMEEMRTDVVSLFDCMESRGCIVLNPLDVSLLATCTTLRCTIPLSSALRSIEVAQPCFPPDFHEKLIAWVTSFSECLKNASTEAETLSCYIEYLFPQPIQDWLERLISVLIYFIRLFRSHPGLVDWAIYLVIGKVVLIPAELILAYFGWAELHTFEKEFNGTVSNYTETYVSFVANTQWFYCMLAVCMFLVGFELIKLFGGRYLVWIRR